MSKETGDQSRQQPMPSDSQLTADMVRTIGEKYLRNMYHMSLADRDVTHQDVKEGLMKAQITTDLCLELLDHIILRRYDYLLDNAVNVALKTHQWYVVDHDHNDAVIAGPFTTDWDAGKARSLIEKYDQRDINYWITILDR